MDKRGQACVCASAWGGGRMKTPARGGGVFYMALGLAASFT